MIQVIGDSLDESSPFNVGNSWMIIGMWNVGVPDNNEVIEAQLKANKLSKQSSFDLENIDGI